MSNNRYELELSPAVRSSCRLLYVSASRFDKDWVSLPHTHPCTEIFYCVRGIGEFKIGRDSRPVGSDDLVIVNPNVEHTEVSVASNPLEYIVLGVDGMEFSSGDQSSGYSMLNFREYREETLFYLRELLHEVESKGAGYESISRNLLEVLLFKLLRHSRQAISILPQRRANKECAAVKRYIDANYAESISLDQLSEMAHVNKYYLVHSFSREYGISPISYLIERRIRESKYFLANTDHSLSQISQVLGFSSPSYFSQSFRKLEGISPNEYRKAQRASEAAPHGQSRPR